MEGGTVEVNEKERERGYTQQRRRWWCVCFCLLVVHVQLPLFHYISSRKLYSCQLFGKKFPLAFTGMNRSWAVLSSSLQAASSIQKMAWWRHFRCRDGRIEGVSSLTTAVLYFRSSSTSRYDHHIALSQSRIAFPSLFSLARACCTLSSSCSRSRGLRSTGLQQQRELLKIHCRVMAPCRVAVLEL